MNTYLLKLCVISNGKHIQCGFKARAANLTMARAMARAQVAINGWHLCSVSEDV